MDSIIIAISQGVTLTLPTNAEDGQIYFIRNHSNGDVHVYGRISPLGYPTSETKKCTYNSRLVGYFLYMTK